MKHIHTDELLGDSTSIRSRRPCHFIFNAHYLEHTTIGCVKDCVYAEVYAYISRCMYRVISHASKRNVYSCNNTSNFDH